MTTGPREDPALSGHWCHLETASLLTRAGSWRAACQCGWVGRWRTAAWETAVDQAVQDGLDHQASLR